MQRLTSAPFLGLLFLGATLAAGPVLAKITGAPDTVAVVSPSLSTSNATTTGCTPANPCAVVTPALGSVTMSTPEMPAQPDLPADTAAGKPAAPAAPAGAAQTAAKPNCPPAGDGFRRFARAGNRNGGAEGGGRGFGGGVGGTGRGQQMAQNGGAGAGRGRGFARDANGCPRPAGAGQGRNPAAAQPAGR